MHTRLLILLLIPIFGGCQDAPKIDTNRQLAINDGVVAADAAATPAAQDLPGLDERAAEGLAQPTALHLFDETPLPEALREGEPHPFGGDPNERWLFSKRKPIGSLMISPSEAAAERQREKFDLGRGHSDGETYVIEWPLRGANGKLRRERLKVGKNGNWHEPYTIAYFLPEDGPPLNLPTHEIHADDTGIDVYAEWEGQYDISPDEDFPLWVNPAEFTEPFSLTFISTAREIVWAAFVHPLPDQPMRLYASPDPNAPLLAEVYAEDIGPPELGGIGAEASGLDDVSADGEWIHVTVTYNTDIWCAGEQLRPDVTGWIRWRNDDGSPRVEWQARYSC